MLSVILDDTRDAARNLALDEALARAAALRARASRVPARRVPDPLRSVPHVPGPRTAVRRGEDPPDAAEDRPARPQPPVLRVWQSSPSVVVGRFQDVARAVDLVACAGDGIDVVRRATGGGAVWFDSGTLAFSLVQRPGHRVSLDALVVAALEGLGVAGEALRDGRVVQGARLHTRGACLSHVAVQVRPAPRHAGGRAAHRCTASGGRAGGAARPALADLGPGMTVDAVRAAVLGAVMDEFGAVRTRRPDAVERAVRDHLHAVRYGDLAWHLTGPRAAAARQFSGRT
ncbi:hypothetical protein AGRA3207_005392 [Actinomadura graeca]|uniref:BPL/LPL catalytic domain-containing protein n=1 Tax=Actinomadura graeca TaxID=2750812 RepID=A0ABX8R0Q6_9ACTN|nr:hypothetical protein [Actinomadura graeca]QXJ24131.1 hypothetical protein AGRA3207_005392 [Actinomadura graeca]